MSELQGPVPPEVSAASGRVLSFVLSRRAGAFTHIGYDKPVGGKPIGVLLVITGEPDEMAKVLDAVNTATGGKALTSKGGGA